MIDQIGTEKAGSEQHLLWLLRKLPEDRLEKHFIVFCGIRAADPTKFPVAPTILGKTYGEGSLKSFLRRFRALVRYIREHRIDVIHAFTPRDELVGVLAARLAGKCRVVAHRRNVGYLATPKSKRYTRIVQYFNVPYIANSEAAKDAAFHIEGIRPQRFTLIRNPVSLQRLEEGEKNRIPRSELHVPEDAKIVGMVATIRPIKGHDTLLKAAKIILEQFPDTYFLLVGEQEHPWAETLKTLASDLGIADHILWFGGIENPFQILHHFDVAVLSSNSESFSNAVLEYSVAGLPIVATEVGGMKEIVLDGETGFLVPPGNPEQFAERVIELLRDPEKRKQFGQAGRKYVMRQYEENAIVDQYLDFYTAAK